MTWDPRCRQLGCPSNFNRGVGKTCLSGGEIPVGTRQVGRYLWTSWGLSEQDQVLFVLHAQGTQDLGLGNGLLVGSEKEAVLVTPTQSPNSL